MSKIVSVYTVTNLGCSRNLTLHINLTSISVISKFERKKSIIG